MILIPDMKKPKPDLMFNIHKHLANWKQAKNENAQSNAYLTQRCNGLDVFWTGIDHRMDGGYQPSEEWLEYEENRLSPTSVTTIDHGCCTT